MTFCGEAQGGGGGAEGGGGGAIFSRSNVLSCFEFSAYETYSKNWGNLIEL